MFNQSTVLIELGTRKRRQMQIYFMKFHIALLLHFYDTYILTHLSHFLRLCFLSPFIF